MNKIRRSWLGGGSVMVLVAAGLIGLGACSGSDDGLSQAQEEALQEALEEAIEDRDQAEDERDDTIEERDDALEERDDARDDLQGEQQENQGLQEERDDLQEERDEAQQKLDRFVALEIVNAIPATIPDPNTIPSVPSFLSYGEPVLATATGATFTSTNTGSSEGWFTTTRSGSGEQRRDFVEIFSNVEIPIREDIRDYSAREADEVPTGVTTQLPWGLTFDEQGRPTNHLDITTGNAGTIATSSRFPRPSTQRQGELETFTVTDQGPSETQKQAARDAKAARDTVIAELRADNIDDSTQDLTPYDTSQPDYRLAVRTDRYPERYSIDISGMLQGAPGTFRCAGTSVDAGSDGSCTVDLSGPNNYVFGTTDDSTAVEWQFIPTSATSKVSIPDGEYMWFGWWQREPIETTPNADDAVYNYAANYGGLNQVGGSGNPSFTGATGPATYEGEAIGYYGFYDIEAAEDDRSRSGRFQAKATLIADFSDATGEGTLSGSITEFDTEPTWSVTLRSQSISSGVVEAADDSVSWSIRGLPRDGGEWEAKFYSNFEEPADTAQPTGVAGAFTAQYGDHRKMVGAFGAERDN